MAGSLRIQSVQQPVIPDVAALIRAHPGTISLGQGVVSYGPPAEVAPAIERFWANPGHHKYQAVDGIPELKALLVAKLESENGIFPGADQSVVVTAGSNMGFLNALLAIADPGDEIILQTPYYFNHEMAITMANCRPVLVPTDRRHQLQPERIRAAIGPRTRAVVTISPNNPTGAVYPEPALREVNGICREAGVFHIHDEAYEYFVYDGAEHFSPGSIANSAGHTISLFSLSKAYGFASWRIGYMVLPAELLEAVMKIQDTNIVCPPVISQYAAIGALEAGRAFCEEKLRPLGETRLAVREHFRELEAICSIPSPGGAFYYLLEVNSGLAPMAIVTRLVEEHGVAAIPGTAFGIHDRCCLRVAYGALEPDTAIEGVGRFVRGLIAIVGPAGPRPQQSP